MESRDWTADMQKIACLPAAISLCSAYYRDVPGMIFCLILAVVIACLPLFLVLDPFEEKKQGELKDD